ncbi:MAG: heparinase II/III family protein [Chthoniobacteraceae bacterium]
MNKMLSSPFVRHRLCVGLSCLLLAAPVIGVAAEPQTPEAFRTALKALPESVKTDPERKEQLEAILREAQRVRDLPLVERAQSLQELENPGDRRIGKVDKRTYVVAKTDPKKAETFAIASSDVDVTRYIEHDLPLLAAAYVITGDKSYVDRIAAQLRETATWEPLQRPGWMLYQAVNSLPPDGDDGVWLATGRGLSALWQTLDILPPGALPPDVMDKIREQYRREAARITHDWQAKKMWFVKNDVSTCNQWVAPAAGQAMACASLGRDADPVSYDLALKNLLHTVENLGADGSTSEGAGYTMDYTAPLLYMAADALSSRGDNRLAEQSFLRNLPRWIAMQFQPGQWIINVSDNFGGARGAIFSMAPQIARLVSLSRDPELAWVLRHVLHNIPYDVNGLVSLTIPEDSLRQPPLWSSFEHSTSAVWRSGWDENASGVWVKGAFPNDGHDHHDRGHVNFIADGRAVLIEAATAGYDNPLKREKYDSVVGHNVLQVGDDLFPAKVAAPITVARMDKDGGDVTVNAGQGYPDVKQWKRHVTWTAHRMEVTDEVVLKKPEKVLFRWHLGSEQPLQITPGDDHKSGDAKLGAARITFTNPPDDNKEVNLSWVRPAKETMETPEAVLAVQADQPIQCDQEKNLDHAFRFRHKDHPHTTFVVRSAGPVESITLKTSVEVPLHP